MAAKEATDDLPSKDWRGLADFYQDEVAFKPRELCSNLGVRDSDRSTELWRHGDEHDGCVWIGRRSISWRPDSFRVDAMRFRRFICSLKRRYVPTRYCWFVIMPGSIRQNAHGVGTTQKDGYAWNFCPPIRRISIHRTPMAMDENGIYPQPMLASKDALNSILGTSLRYAQARGRLAKPDEKRKRALPELCAFTKPILTLVRSCRIRKLNGQNFSGQLYLSNSIWLLAYRSSTTANFFSILPLRSYRYRKRVLKNENQFFQFLASLNRAWHLLHVQQWILLRGH